jgi:hypothetical protein
MVFSRQQVLGLVWRCKDLHAVRNSSGVKSPLFRLHQPAKLALLFLKSLSVSDHVFVVTFYPMPLSCGPTSSLRFAIGSAFHDHCADVFWLTREGGTEHDPRINR